MRPVIPCTLLIICLLSASCKKELSASGSSSNIITVQFVNDVGMYPLTLFTQYANTFNEEFSLTAFKYYVSNFQLISSNGAVQTIPGIYDLVDAADTVSQSFSFPATADSLIAISFLVGVDSTRVVDGPRTGDLDPANGMYWNDTLGYIMAKLEGTSPASTAPNNTFQYDIGGYSGPFSVLRKITLTLNGSSISLDPFQPDTLVITLAADVDAWFEGPHDLPIGGGSSCTAPGMLASEYADNYARMFSVRDIQVK
jgi:hypothetical protein